MRNSSIKKYTPVYERTWETYASGPQWMSLQKVTVPVHERGNVTFYEAIPSTKPKVGYTVQRLRSRRAGQLELVPVLKGASNGR